MAKEIPDICKGCIKWDVHGKSCWVFWDEKKVCTHYKDKFGDNKPGFKNLKKPEFNDFSHF